MRINDITSAEMSLFADIVGRLGRHSNQEDVRRATLGDLVTLLRADGGASYVWEDARNRFCGSFYVGMSPEIPPLYNEWYQFHDPITFRMRSKRCATIVDEVIDRKDLIKTEFYNDFLKIDDLEWGINIYLFDDQGQDLGDFRFWRRSYRSNFDEREKALLEVIAPHARAALLQTRSAGTPLTTREREVTRLISRGCTDKDIARILDIGFGTVRTHVNRALEKCGCANRAELAVAFIRSA